MSLQRRVHLLFEEAATPIAIALRWGLAALILVNVAAAVLQTVPALARDYDAAFGRFEVVSLSIFSAEYVLRLWSVGCDSRYPGLFGRLRWMVTPAALIDLVAVLPALVFAVEGDMRILRLLRLARLLRIAKLSRYSLALRTLQRVLISRMPDLLSVAFVLLILLILSSSLMFHLEHDVQPEVFDSVPAAMWWGIITLTTIGYGDMAPMSAGGRLLGALVAILGIGMFALPAGLLGSAFVEEFGKLRRGLKEPGEAARCPHCQQPLDR